MLLYYTRNNINKNIRSPKDQTFKMESLTLISSIGEKILFHYNHFILFLLQLHHQTKEKKNLRKQHITERNPLLKPSCFCEYKYKVIK